jgi:hypothetical protein
MDELSVPAVGNRNDGMSVRAEGFPLRGPGLRRIQGLSGATALPHCGVGRQSVCRMGISAAADPVAVRAAGMAYSFLRKSLRILPGTFLP